MGKRLAFGIGRHLGHPSKHPAAGMSHGQSPFANQVLVFPLAFLFFLLIPQIPLELRGQLTVGTSLLSSSIEPAGRYTTTLHTPRQSLTRLPPPNQNRHIINRHNEPRRQRQAESQAYRRGDREACHQRRLLGHRPWQR